MFLRRTGLLVVLLTLLPALARAEDRALDPSMQALADARPSAPAPLAPMHLTPCVGGFAGAYPCSNIDLLAFVPIATFAASSTNSLWGWTDSTTGIEYALVGANNGIAFFDLAQPDHPRYLGKLPTRTGSSFWRDVRVYADHAFVVSDNNGEHGMQVFALSALRNVSTPQTFSATANYVAQGMGPGHTIAINEDTGYAYVSGSDTCGGASHIVDIRVPAAPVFAGCIGGSLYTHETQCWTYDGPDAAHAGKDICFESKGSGRRIEIVDVSNHASPVVLSSTPYTGARYTHQGWLTPDHRWLLVNDELDESNFGHNARTYVIDVADLDAPVVVGYHQHALPVVDHNLYVHGNYVFESNYEAGVRILRLGNLSQAQMTEVAYFDTYPSGNAASFNGSWNNYRFPGSGNLIATGIDEGFFVLRPQLCTAPAVPGSVTATANGDGRIDLSWSGTPGNSYRVERAQGGCGGTFATIADEVPATSYSDTSASGSVSYGYRVVAKDNGGSCESVASACAVAQTTGACTAPPQFAGLASAQSPGLATCRVDLQWPAASSACGGAVTYSLYRSGTQGFTPSPANLIASGIQGTSHADLSGPTSVLRHYVVRARDAGNGAEEGNRVELAATAVGPLGDGSFTSGAEPGDSPLDSGTFAEPGAPKALVQPKHAGWHTSLARFHGGSHSFWSTTANNLCITLESPPLVLTPGQSSEVSFWTAWSMGGTADGGVVEVSNNDGASWTRLTPAGGYPGTLTGGTLCGIAAGSAAFTGTNLTWTQRNASLAAYAGQSVRVRWMFRSDANVSGEGWFVDDVTITHAQVPGTCTVADALLLRDGFE